MPPSCVNAGGAGSTLRLPGTPALDRECPLDESHRAVLAAWNARPGEILTAIDAENNGYRVRLTRVDANPACVPFAKLGRPAESPLSLAVYQALPEKERFELVLQKLTELGATRIVPVETERSVTLEERDAVQAKSRRWPEVVRRAARQCRRAILPELFAVTDFVAALQLACDAELKLMLYEGEEHWSLREAIAGQRPERVALLVGPEGGFTEREVSAARAAGFLPVTLGPRILRTETAAIAGATLLQGLLGDLCRS